MDEFLFDEPELPDLADDFGDDEETDEGEGLTLLSLSEQAAWIAGAIARHYEREGCQGRSKTRPLRRRESRPVQGWWKL